MVAAFLGGSRARGEADEYSDIDISLIVSDEAYAEFVSDKGAFARALGEPLFIEDFGQGEVVFVILADGTELELHLLRMSDLPSIRPGPHRVLLNDTGVLERIQLLPPEIDREARIEQLRQLLSWFWHDLGHFTTAIGRGQLWWAAGQLQILRDVCVGLVRIEQGAELDEDEPYWKLDVEVATPPLDALRSTFVPVERDAMLRAGREVLAFFRSRAPGVARANGLPYPTELDELIGGRLDQPLHQLGR